MDLPHFDRCDVGVQSAFGDRECLSVALTVECVISSQALRCIHVPSGNRNVTALAGPRRCRAVLSDHSDARQIRKQHKLCHAAMVRDLLRTPLVGSVGSCAGREATARSGRALRERCGGAHTTNDLTFAQGGEDGT